MHRTQNTSAEGAHGGHHRSHPHRNATRGYLVSPNEVRIAGAQGAAKSALVASLRESLGTDRRVALVAAGSNGTAARYAFENGDGLLARGLSDEWNGYDLANEADIVLFDGDLGAASPKVVVVGPEGLPPGEASGDDVVACVLLAGAPGRVREEVEAAAGGLPLFEAAQTEAIASLLLAELDRRARAVPLYGLVLGGGRSTRMKRDKAAIDYRGEPQVRHAYRLLGQFCERVFVSNRAEQSADPLFGGLEQIPDRFLGIGPMGGMLSAFHAHPEAAWIVLGCDLPFVDEATLADLVAERDPLKLATCYLSAHDGLPEPLCALYEPRYRRRLHQFLADGRDCPRKALINSRAKRIALADPAALDNINSPEDYELAMARIRKGA